MSRVQELRDLIAAGKIEDVGRLLDRMEIEEIERKKLIAELRMVIRMQLRRTP